MVACAPHFFGIYFGSSAKCARIGKRWRHFRRRCSPAVCTPDDGPDPWFLLGLPEIRWDNYCTWGHPVDFHRYQWRPIWSGLGKAILIKRFIGAIWLLVMSRKSFRWSDVFCRIRDKFLCSLGTLWELSGPAKDFVWIGILNKSLKKARYLKKKNLNKFVNFGALKIIFNEANLFSHSFAFETHSADSFSSNFLTSEPWLSEEQSAGKWQE